MKLRIFGDPVVYQLGPVPITETMVASLAVTIVLVIAAVVIRRTVAHSPRHWLSTLAMLTVEWLDELVKDIVGRPEPNVTPHRPEGIAAGTRVPSGNRTNRGRNWHSSTALCGRSRRTAGRGIRPRFMRRLQLAVSSADG